MSLWLKSNIKVIAKIVEYEDMDVPIDELTVSFNETFKDYVIYFPKHLDQMITRIGDVEFGFGSRYLLLKLLEEVKKLNPSGVVNTKFMEIRTIPKIEEPIMRRLGEKLEWEIEYKPTSTLFVDNSATGEVLGDETGDRRKYQENNTGTDEDTYGQIL